MARNRSRQIAVGARVPRQAPELPAVVPVRRQWWTRTKAVVITSTAIAGGIVFWITLPATVDSTVQSMGLMPKDVSKATVTAAPATAAYTGGWGPARETFTMGHPADYAVLNSITDNNLQGDERNFVQIKLPPGRYVEEVNAVPGDKISVYAYAENDVADNLASGTSAVRGFTARMVLGQTPEGKSTIGVVYDGKNIQPVWDGATVKSASKIKLAYIPGSLRFVTNHSPEGGFVVPDSQFGKLQPVQLGETAMNGSYSVATVGDMPGGRGYLLFDVLVVDASS
ncbi:hypothetical protein IV500_17100 [Paeniglutamicibacter antarcticus]|uniref:Uncharacterized protein n=1 Tax=Arthrobacter terrae TaxID=2935737 RepID=A0A931CQC0_9MICC|nr:hypothetical protein [Arthrobacter terrae]MBG0741092.1 hypothetical protein [Arthrobacter terrae]